MNEIVETLLLTGDKFMTEMSLEQLGFTYSACGPFSKSKERIQKFIQTRNTNYIYNNDLDKACFQHDMVYGKYKDSTKRTESDKVLRDKAFKIANNPKYDGYETGLASMVYKFIDKKSTGINIKSTSNQQLADELHKSIITKFKIRKVNSSFKYNIWGVDLADMQLISKYNKGIKSSLSLINIFSTYVSVVPLKIKKGISITNASQSILIWVERNNSKP